VDSDLSISGYFSAFRVEDPDVARRAWEVYFGRLIDRAVAHLRGTLGPGRGEEDIALGALEDARRGALAGRYPRLDDPDGLWPLLLVATARRSVAPWLDDPGLILEGSFPGEGGAIDAKGRLDPDFDPGPGFATLLIDELRHLMARLGEPRLRQVAALKLGGDDLEEIAARLGRAGATVERKLRRVGLLWRREADREGRREAPGARAANGCPEPDAWAEPVDPFRTIDEACDRFEESWRPGGPRPRPEAFLAGAVDRRALLRELLPLDFELRSRESGPSTSPDEHLGRTVEDAGPASSETLAAGTPTNRSEDAPTINWDREGGGQAPPTANPSPSRRFRRIRLHSRGGLGAVFVAYDTELRREVALKQILDPRTDNAVNRSRFVVEAEITGWLEHPGIAPVYSLGVDDDGRPYYAMRFIRGESLRQAIDQFHSEGGPRGDPGLRSLGLQKLLRQFLDVCDTVEYAHSRGVIHRDIKPNNVVVGQHGETMLVDWGLAKFIGVEDRPAGEPSTDESPFPPGREDIHETVDGTALGTPAYMSPEQAEGRLGAVEYASDVYSLGATLHDLLTGRAPKFGRVDGEVRSTRRVDRLVPAALEAVVLKAMALRPEDRYPSARALAEDIEHWLAAEPVSAYREPIAARARRWWRRHPRVTGAAVAATAVALVILIGATILLRESSKREALARSQAETRLVLAIESVAEFGSRFTDDPRIRAQGLETFRRDLLLRARDFYREIARGLKGGNDPRLRVESGRTYLRLALIAFDLGNQPEAREAAEMAIEGFTDLLRERPGDAPCAEGLAQSLECLGDIAVREFRYEAARRSFVEAEAAWETPGRGHPEARAHRIGQAGSITRLGRVLRFQEDLEAAEVALKRGLTLCDGDEPDSRGARAGLLEDLGHVQEARAVEKPRDSDAFATLHGAARKTLEESFGLRSRLNAESPADLNARIKMIACFTSFASVCWDGRDPAPIEHHLGKVRAMAEDLVREHPDVFLFKGLLGWCDAIRAMSLALRGEHERAAEVVELAVSEAPKYGPAILYAIYGLCKAAEAVPPGGPVAEKYLDRAMALLRQCGDLGFFRNRLIVKEMRTGVDFRVMRGRRDFQDLLAEVAPLAGQGK
jgi:tRNA A-37 threonylcarbamoyl transferase component Bud32/tetratricopeptide (TPR) repeat protein